MAHSPSSSLSFAETDRGVDCDCPIFAISGIDLSRKSSTCGSHSLSPEAGQGDLKGALMKVLMISTAVSGEVDMPETARTLALLMERAFLASSAVRQVAA